MEFKKKDRISVGLTVAVRDALEEEHSHSGLTRSAIIRQAILEFVALQKQKRLEQTLAYDKLMKKIEDAKEAGEIS
jgi:hypothetical protein